MKRILHIINGLSDGGAEAVLFRLCVTDRDAQHYVVSLTGPGKYGAQLEELGVRVKCLHMQRLVGLVGSLKTLTRIIREYEPDAVQTWMYHASLIGSMAARIARFGKVYWGIHHSELTPSTTSRSTLVVSRILAALSSQLPTGIIYCASRAKLSHELKRFDKTKSLVIPNGYDLGRFSPSDSMRSKIRHELNIDSNEPVVGMVARWHPDKDHELLLKALNVVHNKGISMKCLLVGNGMVSRNQELNELISKYDLSESCYLLSTRSDVNAIMNAIDVHVLSSRTEAFPNVLAEAMACATPCISTDVGDASTIIGDSGWVVPRGDVDSLARSLAFATSEIDTPEFSMRAAAARRRVEENFSIQDMIQRYHEAWSICS